MRIYVIIVCTNSSPPPSSSFLAENNNSRLSDPLVRYGFPRSKNGFPWRALRIVLNAEKKNLRSNSWDHADKRNANRISERHSGDFSIRGRRSSSILHKFDWADHTLVWHHIVHDLHLIAPCDNIQHVTDVTRKNQNQILPRSRCLRLIPSPVKGRLECKRHAEGAFHAQKCFSLSVLFRFKCRTNYKYIKMVSRPLPVHLHFLFSMDFRRSSNLLSGEFSKRLATV